MGRPIASATELINDARVRVTRFDFAPGAQTGWHIHELDYVITAITDCEMMLETPDGENAPLSITPGTVYRRNRGVEHNVINDSSNPMTFIEIELK